MVTAIVIIGAITGFVIGSTIGYCVGRTDGEDGAARYYEKKRRRA